MCFTHSLLRASECSPRSHWYIFVVLGSFLFLFVLYTGAFIMGMFHYNEDIPPTKRTDASNYAGTAMLL